jgi:hypothetical protein
MRKFYFVFLGFFFPMTLIHAQVEKGQKILLGGISAGYSRNEVDTQSLQKQLAFSIAPGFGKAIKKNLVLGYIVSVGVYNSHNESFVDKTLLRGHAWNAGGGVFLRRYFPLARGFSFSGDITGFYSHRNSKSELSGTLVPLTTTSHNRINEFSVNISSALVYAFNKRWLGTVSLNNFAGFYLNEEKAENKGGASSFITKTSQAGFSFQVNNSVPFSGLTIGFTYVL